MLHDSLEFAMSQAAPQVWQSVRLVRLVSQPLLGFASQFPQSVPLQVKVQPLVVLHAAVPCALVHDSPQLRQFDVVPFVVSHPAWVVQSKKPALHSETLHVPLEQDEVAFGKLHVTPQSPQFVSVCRSVSQPLPALPSQLLYPLAQLGLQAKFGAVPAHDVVPCVFAHASPHAAQFEPVPSCVSQPAWLEQSAKPALQPVSTHWPVPHEAVPCARLQATPQPLQFVSVFSCVSQPSLAVPSFELQSSQPLLHDAIWQLPDAQVGVPWALLQARPHPPQSVSELSCVSQPLFLSPSQSPQPEAHAGWQPFVVHAFVPCALLQLSPHCRQLAVGPSAVSQPSVSTPLQSAYPASHETSPHLEAAQLPLPFL